MKKILLALSIAFSAISFAETRNLEVSSSLATGKTLAVKVVASGEYVKKVKNRAILKTISAVKKLAYEQAQKTCSNVRAELWSYATNVDCKKDEGWTKITGTCVAVLKGFCFESTK